MWFTKVEIRMGTISVNSVLFSLKASIFKESWSSFSFKNEMASWVASILQLYVLVWLVGQNGLTGEDTKKGQILNELF